MANFGRNWPPKGLGPFGRTYLPHLAKALDGVASGRVQQVLGVLVLHGDVVLEEDDDAKVKQNFQTSKSQFDKLQRERSVLWVMSFVYTVDTCHYSLRVI